LRAPSRTMAAGHGLAAILRDARAKPALLRVRPNHLPGLALAGAIMLAPAAAKADAVADFFKGKVVRLVVAYPPGGGYDVYARALAQVLPRHLPGNPAVIVQYMPGAGSLTATNYLYAAAEKDGTVVLAPSNSAAFAPLQGVDGAKFDPTQFNWIGSPSKETGILIVWHTAPVAAVADLRSREITLGTSSANASSGFYGRVLNAALSLRMKLVRGYRGSTESFLAMERGEVDGYASAFWNSLKSTKPDWLRDRKVKLLLQYGVEPNPELAGVPFARDLAAADDDKILLDVANAPLAFGRPFVLPPGVPAERVAAWRKAFLDSYRDPALIAEAARLEIDIDPSTGEEMQDMLARAYATPQRVIARLRSLYEAETGR
jgi:tripartite-type tricarboxylate transporter receptor subunit TctC